MFLQHLNRGTNRSELLIGFLLDLFNITEMSHHDLEEVLVFVRTLELLHVFGRQI